MRKWATLLLLVVFSWPAMAAKTMSVNDVEQLLVKLHGKPDGKVAGELDNVQLTERVSAARLARWQAEFPSHRVHDEFMRLVDMSAFLDPPADDVLHDPRPDFKTQQHMLVMAAQYVMTTMSRLPDFYATRETTHFEGTLSQHVSYSVQEVPGGRDEHEPLSAISLAPAGVATSTEFKALHNAGSYSRTVTFRSGHEVLYEDAGKQKREPSLGLSTSGEFGPMLAQVLSDALESLVSFQRWEQGPNGRVADFNYLVPEKASHFRVGISSGSQAQSIHPAYHGEIEIDPETGEILRLSEEADMTPPHQEMRAAIVVEYAPVTIGGRSYICPVSAVAFSKTPVPPVGTVVMGPTVDQSGWPVQSELNDVAFTQYHEFGSEARIVADASVGAGVAATGSGSEATASEASASAPSPGSNSASAAVPASSPESDSRQATKSASSVSSEPNVEPSPTPAPNPASGPTQVAASAPASSAPAKSGTESTESVAPFIPPAGASATETVFHAKSRLVLVDVAITDRDRPVKGLDQSRFHVFEDGHEQAIASFEEFEPAAKVTVNEPPALPPNTYSNLPVYSQTGAVNVLLLDALNTPMGDQEQVRRAMIDYLGKIRPGTSLAIFTLSSRLRMAAGFTTDVAQLLKVLQSKKAASHPSAILGPGQGGDLSTTIQQAASSMAISNDPGTMRLVNQIMQFAADTKTYENDQRVQMTLEAFSELARNLTAVPGRKNVIWFSGSFPIGLGPNAGVSTPIKDLRDYSGELQRTSQLLSAARVAVYPVDARGLTMAPTADAGFIPPPVGGVNNPGSAVASANRSFEVQTSLEQGSMNTIATETGGHVYSTGNDLTAALDKIMANDSHYYALSYVPPDTKEGKNGDEFHTIEIKVDGARYQLAYRRGYYTPGTSVPAGNASGVPSLVKEAAQLGTPPSTQILFQARVLPESDPAFNGVAVDDKAAGEKTTSFPGGSHRYVVDLSIQPQDVTFTEGASGMRQAQVKCALVVFDGQGSEVNSVGRSLSLNLSAEQYRRLTAAGQTVPVRLALDLPSGELALRIVVYDPASARTGSLEIPLQSEGEPKGTQASSSSK